MIFFPQPLLFEIIKKEKWLVPKINSYQIGIYSNSDPDIQFPESKSMNTMPEYIIRDPTWQMSNDIDAILKAYSGAVCNLTKTKKNLSSRDIQDEMAGFIDKMSGKKINWVPASFSCLQSKPKDKAITLKIPSEGDKSVCISFDIDSFGQKF